MKPLKFTSWHPLNRREVRAHAPDAPAAVQLRLADGLVDYPSGHSSAMVCYFHASDSARETLAELFGDELDTPGVRGHGPLEFRYIDDDQRSLNHLQKLMHKFHTQFGAFPLFNQKDQ